MHEIMLCYHYHVLLVRRRGPLGSITMNKDNGGNGIPVELFQILRDASKFGKLSSCLRTEKCKFSFQSQRKAMPENAHTTAQLHSCHTLASSVQFSCSVI